MTSLQSPTIGTSACRFLEISAGSMSAWITLASGANVSSLPGHAVVEAGAERDQQVGCAAARPTAATVPCMPGMPRCCGCESGNAPRAISVVTTGIAGQRRRARSSSADAPDRITPPPT